MLPLYCYAAFRHDAIISALIAFRYDFPFFLLRR